MKNGVFATTEFLELFLRNLLLDEENVLQNRAMHIGSILKEEEAPYMFEEYVKAKVEESYEIESIK